MTRIAEIIECLERSAPKAYQESYDNAGLNVGNAEDRVRKVLFCLDCTEEVLDEAVEKDCNLIVSHHPVIFGSLKSLTGKSYAERTVIKAIKNNIALYAAHTNLDNVQQGVNFKIAEKLGLSRVAVLKPKSGKLQKLTTFVPNKEARSVLKALYQAGAGQIGNYQNCSFEVGGMGTFMPNEGAQPYKGKVLEQEFVEEQRIELIFPAYLQAKVLQALFDAHPYEEVAYFVHQLENKHQGVGSGAIGYLPEAMSEKDFMVWVKQSMGIRWIKHSSLLNKKIESVALCGGAGIFLLPDAIKQKADVFITSDVKYHDFFDADKKILLLDIGHYESEIFTKELFYDILSQKFPNIAFYISNVVTNPVSYT